MLYSVSLIYSRSTTWKEIFRLNIPQIPIRASVYHRAHSKPYLIPSASIFFRVCVIHVSADKSAIAIGSRRKGGRWRNGAVVRSRTLLSSLPKDKVGDISFCLTNNQTFLKPNEL